MPARVVPWIAALLLVCAAGLAWSAATTDSVTVDEPAHVTAGYASLVTGDFRLSPDHPPLARWLLALPLLSQEVHWKAAASPAWETGDVLTLGREFFESWNDGQQLVRSSRAVAIGLFLLLVVTVGTAARALFGSTGGLVAATVVALDPNWLAHGHLATVDVPFALAALATLLSAHSWLRQPTRSRLALLAASFAAATLVKFSWPTLVPALVGMAIVDQRKDGWRATLRTLAVATSALALTTIVAIWAAYGFRFTACAPGASPARHMIVLSDFGHPPPADAKGAWETLLHDPRTGVDRAGMLVPLLRRLHALQLLPEGYLYGLAYVGKSTLFRAAYLRGSYSTSGFASYFPWAAAVKTPLPVLALFALGIVAMARRRGATALPALEVGLAVFAIGFATALISGGLNIGYRHALPVTAVLAVGSGGVLTFASSLGLRRAGRWAVALLLLVLAAGTLRAASNWIGYFNEAAGGWRNGHRFLADSNLDWGQDLLRLRARLASEPAGTPVWLAQAGDPPLPAGLAVRRLWPAGAQVPELKAIAGGLYVVSATELLGVYRPLARPAAWRDGGLQARFEEAAARAASSLERPHLDELEALRRLRLVSRLAQREPDERLGTSLFLFRLSDAEVAEWTTP